MLDSQQTYQVLIERKNILEQYQKLLDLQKPRSIISIPIIIGILSIGYFPILWMLIQNFIRFVSDHSLFMNIIYFVFILILIVIAIIVYTVVLYFIGLFIWGMNYFLSSLNTTFKLKVIEIKKKKEKLETKYQELSNLLVDSVMPKEFQEVTIVEYVNHVIQQGRVTTITEAIHLYAEDPQHQEQIQIQNMKQQYYKTHNEMSALEKDLALERRKLNHAQGSLRKGFLSILLHKGV
ncbi:hypothetical protein QUF99_12015 [Bacillus sp. DX4.1]|uniref:hypothetical protein n=1 Tax=Bacillus sp. DX4.1 TaxID=3055867 RepID=UPI0025A01A85|nr:hypothetical protein [Bacillus sp. DX4.1]MDM5188019.1 hypothetical protein [Bacillus sp. DX4.1]